MEASQPYSDPLVGLESSGLDKSYVMSSYFGLKSVLVSHCLRDLESVRAIEEDPAFFAEFCKKVVTRDDGPEFDDVRKRYEQLVNDVYECMTSIPEGQVCELSRSPEIYACRDAEDVRIDFNGSRDSLKALVSGKHYSDSVVLLAYFMVEREQPELSPLYAPKSVAPAPSVVESKSDGPRIWDEMESERKKLMVLARQSRWVLGKKQS